MIDMGETITIPLTTEIRDLLKKYGQKGETYNEPVLLNNPSTYPSGF